MKIEIKENEAQKMMLIDGVSQGVSDKDNNPISPYMKFVVDHINTLKPFSDLLFLGGGAMLVPGWAKREKGMNITVFENDPEVYEKAKEHFQGLGLGPVVYIVDAKAFSGYLSHQLRYDLVFLDCYVGSTRSQGLYTTDYAQLCKGRLKDKGTFCVNYAGTEEEIYKY